MSIPKGYMMVIVVNLVKTLFCTMLPVGVVLCMPGHYRVCPPLAAIIAIKRAICLLQGVTGVLQEFQPIDPTGFG